MEKKKIGRPKGEPTKLMRVPIGLVVVIKQLIEDYRKKKSTKKE